MKTKIAINIILWCCFSHFLHGQNADAMTCQEKLAAAKLSRKQESYEKAIRQLQAAEAVCGKENSLLVEEEVIGIFNKIEEIRIQAQVNEQIAKNEKESAVAATIKADSLTLVAKFALDTVKALVQKAKVLENTFSDSSAYDYLVTKGKEYFAYNITDQRRDYKNALTYFALAHFLKPEKDTANTVVKAMIAGIAAEDAFYEGKLEVALLKNDTVAYWLGQNYDLDCKFEEKRREQIFAVAQLFKKFKEEYPTKTQWHIELEGDWLTLPQEMLKYKNNTLKISFRDNSFNFHRFPMVLDSFKNLKSMTFENCANIQNLKDWKQTEKLDYLELRGNPNLYSVTDLYKLPALSKILVRNCTALTLIDSIEQLINFKTEKSPQLRIENILSKNKNLQTLDLADLPDGNLDFSNLTELSSLSLTRMKANNLNGLDKNKKLSKLAINGLDELESFTPPSQLDFAQIEECKSLNDLSHWPASDVLKVMLLRNNDKLTNLPKWENFTALNTLLIENDDQLLNIRKSKSLRNTKEIYLINNPNLRTNSLHLGFGYDWDVLFSQLKFSGLKLEFEHRRRVFIHDLGFKGIVSYLNKRFYDENSTLNRTTEGYVFALGMTYYAQNWIYVGLGGGFGKFQSWFADKAPQKGFKVVWVNNIGFQFAPYFLKKDKLSLSMDLYTVSTSLKDYYINPAFGLTYYHTLGMKRKTYFIRPSDTRRHTFYGGGKVKIGDLPKEMGKKKE
jgi:hypothetical protein